ncbi:Glycine receptor subunit beta [Nibea albiflora]|uniref:Glycine receptor subunit beta n=1 Tax=Nibea albiflora TaxID=240163 RepID=A0ACB7FKI9_NIBAL|nr:Glycine receptor subunit beta [Nibea albiflora]
MDEIALPQFDIKQEDIKYGNCTKYYQGTGILSVLSLSSESMSLASELPKVSYVKAIDIWLIACLLFGFSSLVEYAVVETRCKKVCTSKSDLRSNDFSIVGSLPRDFELSNFDCYGKPVEVTGALKSQNKANKKAPPPKPVIPAAAKRIDLYARALFPFSFLFFNVVYWSVYL